MPSDGDQRAFALLRPLLGRNEFLSDTRATGIFIPILEPFSRYTVSLRLSIPSLSARSLIFSFFPQGLLEFSRREHEEKLEIREEQREGRRLRLEEKKAILERMEHPPVSPRYDKRRKRGKKQRKAQSAKGEQSELDSTLISMLPSKTELLPYLPTPNEIVHEREGNIPVGLLGR